MIIYNYNERKKRSYIHAIFPEKFATFSL